jgi:hypothetical protein
MRRPRSLRKLQFVRSEHEPGCDHGGAIFERGGMMVDSGVITDDSLDDDRRKFLTLASTTTGAVGITCAAPVEFDLAKLERGQMTTVTSRRQPTSSKSHLIGANDNKGAA